MWKSRYIRVKIQSVCNNTVSEMVQNNLQPEGTKFSIRVDIVYRVKIQLACNNTVSGMVQNNLLAEETKFSIRVDIVYRVKIQLACNNTVSGWFRITYLLKKQNSATMCMSRYVTE